MLQIAENIKDNWILRVVIIYAVVFWILIKAGVWQASWTIAAFVIFSILIGTFGFVCFRNYASIEDQNFILARLTYTIGPFYVLLLSGPLLLKFLPGPAIVRDIQFFLMIFLAVVWYQISVPFVRSWMRDSPNPERLLRIEQRFAYYGTLSEIMDIDPYISSRVYYAFVTGLMSLILVFSVAVLSEILGESIGLTGFIVSVFVAFISAVALYPMHKRVRKYLKISDSPISASTSFDLKLDMAETLRELHDWSKPIYRYWYLTLSGIVIVFAAFVVYRVVLRFIWF